VAKEIFSKVYSIKECVHNVYWNAALLLFTWRSKELECKLKKSRNILLISGDLKCQSRWASSGVFEDYVIPKR